MSEETQNDKIEDNSCIKKLQVLVKELYEYRDFYLFKRPIEDALKKEGDVKNELTIVLKTFDESEEQALAEDKSKFYYLKGRALNILEEYNLEAEQLLSKAIKLDKNLSDAWNELGFCYWKKKDINGAKNCFLKNAKDKVSLRSLAILLRLQSCDNKAEHIQNIRDSLDKASEAVEIDPSDGMSWLVLGNSYLVHFFSISQNPQKMKQALAAYMHAEKDTIAKVDPDLHYNKGVALQYQEEYEAALKCFNRANELDPSWSLPKEKESKLIQYLDTAQQLTNTKGKIRPKKLTTMLKGLSLKHLGPYEGGQFTCADGKKLDLSLISFKELKPGINKEKLILGKVVSGIHSDESVAFAFCLTDKNSDCLVVSVYNMAMGKGVIIGDSVAIPEPYYQQLNFKYKEKEYNLGTIRVLTPLILVVNGRRLGPELHANTTVTTNVASIAQNNDTTTSNT